MYQFPICFVMENPRFYSAANALQRADAESIMREFSGELNLKKGAKVLDVGCGTGDVTAEILLPLLPTDVSQVIGVDLSESMITHAQNKYQLPNLTFHQLDIEDENDNLFQTLLDGLTSENNNDEDSEIKDKITELLPRRQSVDIFINDIKIESDEEENTEEVLERRIEGMSVNGNEVAIDNENREFITKFMKNGDGRFDAVFSFYCLHWIQNQRQALTNIGSMLTPGGQAILALLAKSTIYTMYELMAEIPKWSFFMQDVQKFISPYQKLENPAETISKIAKEVGFQIVSVECRDRSFSYDNTEDVQEAIKAVNPFCSRLPECMVDEYLSDCLKIISQHKLAEFTDNGYNVNYSLLIVHLRR